MTARGTIYTKRYQKKRRFLGLCPYCGQPIDGSAVLCTACRALDSARSRVRRLKRKTLALSEGTCIKCGRPRLAAGLVCEWHYLQNRADFALGSTSFASGIKQKLIDQDGLCYYTGTPLLLGVNDSLDHLFSVSKHPELRADVDNVVWCTREINTMKNGMDRDEFLVMCRFLAARWPV